MARQLTTHSLYTDLVSIIKEYNPEADAELLKKAIEFSFRAHSKQRESPERTISSILLKPQRYLQN